MRILLVDDETSVIQALLPTLKTLPGHDVRVSTSGEKALESASAMGGLDLLITDVVMEPTDGFTLRDQMVERYPNVRTIFISGYDLSDYPAQTANHQVLQKPIESQALLGAVHRELAALAPTRTNSGAAAVAAVPDMLFQRRTPAGPSTIKTATPAAVPVPVAQPTVKAVPAAQPAAVPVAKPAQPTVKAVPAAQPSVKAVPAAQPTVKAVPAAQPAAVPAAQPTAKAVPAAQPAAVPVARPTAKAVPVAQPAAVPVAKPAQPTARAVPAAQPAAVPVAATPTARAVPAVPAVPVPVAPPAATPPPPSFPIAPPQPSSGGGESLIGQTLGAYQIVSYLGEGRYGSAYAAVQISINRPVGLKVLDPERAQDEAVKARFIADARAKAHVQHPAILSVYEAGEANGRFFFAREYVDGQSLAEIAASGAKLPEPAILKILKTVGEGFLYLQMQNLPHRPLEAGRIFLGAEGAPRLANIAVQVADDSQTVPQELQAFGRILATLVAPGSVSPGLQAVITRLQQAPASGLNAWGQVIQAAKALEPKVIPTAAAKISAQDEAAIQAVEAARKSQRRSFWLNVVSLTVLFAVVVGLGLKKFILTNERKIQRTIKISAGTYKLPSGKTVTIDGDFWIDKYEVTIAQYQKFLDHLDKNPTEDQEFRHPKMPRHLEHTPEYWNIYHGQARTNGKAHSVPIDLNCPALTVTWWDAYAYAKWLGRQTGTERDLPTADEWEVAAAGKQALKYPWGNQVDEAAANTGSDHNPNKPADKNYGKADIDGFNYWSQVDAKSSDKSPFGVVGMGGNVSEWTSSWTKDNRFPIIKGGNFERPPMNNGDAITDHEASKGEEWIGFRTISRNAPADVE